MPLTNYPQGVSSFGIPLIGSGPLLTKGQVFWVDSAHPNASDGHIESSPERPLRTIQAAVSRCVANNGDTILVAPTHVETVVSTGGLSLSVPGISVIGIPAGSRKPQISVGSVTSARVTVPAANVLLQNFLLTGDIDALTIVLSVSGADFTLLDCEYRDVTGECGTFLQTTGGANRMLVDRFVYRGATTAGTARGLGIVGATDVTIRNFHITGNFSIAAINITSTATTRLRVENGFIHNFNSSDGCITDTITGSTGWIGPNLSLSLADNAANITEAVTGATFRIVGAINVVNADNEQSMQINWTVSTDA